MGLLRHIYKDIYFFFFLILIWKPLVLIKWMSGFLPYLQISGKSKTFSLWSLWYQRTDRLKQHTYNIDYEQKHFLILILVLGGFVFLHCHTCLIFLEKSKTLRDIVCTEFLLRIFHRFGRFFLFVLIFFLVTFLSTDCWRSFLCITFC